MLNAEGFYDGFEELQDDPTFADATLICKGERIPCHRVILGAKSRVFKTMFSQKAFKEGIDCIPVKRLPMVSEG